MKKFIRILLLLIIFPLNTFAYSENIIPGGKNIGIMIDSKGLMIVGFYKVDGKYIGKETLKIGDSIIEINGQNVSSAKDMSDIITENAEEIIDITIMRNNKRINTTLNLKLDNGVYKTGLYVKESVTGIGTLTYIDPITKTYGSLGHEIVVNNINKAVEVRTGKIFSSFVDSIDRSSIGKVGSKNASIDYNRVLGIINKNTKVGLFGKYTDTIPNKDLMEVADFDEIELGEAYIYTNVDGDQIKTYKINIKSLNKDKIKTSKSISFEIEDNELMNDTGGVVQGMSGSPIIQNNKIIGAITHVIVSSPSEGYGIFIRTMLEEGDKP